MARVTWQDATLCALLVDLLWRVYKASAAAAKRVMAEQDRPAEVYANAVETVDLGDKVVYIFDQHDKTH